MNGSEVIAKDTTKGRIWFLDWLKLIAAALVVFYHLAYYDLDYGFTPAMAYLPNWNRIVMCFAACSVPLFFMVNGTLLFRKHRTWKEMLLKAAKILVLILIWYAVKFPYWFFRTMIILYMLFPLFQYLRGRHPGLMKFLLAAVFIMPFVYNLFLMCLKGLSLCGVVPDWTHGLTASGCFTMYSVLYFCLGPYLEQAKPWKLRQALLCIAAGWGLVVLECVIYTDSYQTMWDAVNAAFPTVGALLMAVGMFMACRRISTPGAERFLKWTGEGVLAIYLLHMAWIRLLKHLFPLDTYGITLAVVMTIVVCILCILVQKICKKIPALSWLFRI